MVYSNTVLLYPLRMMNRIFQLLLALCVSASAFAEAALPIPPQNVSGVLVQQGLLDEKAVNGAKQVGKTAIYYNRISGGVPFLGLFLGPIGALINSTVVEERKNKDAQSAALAQSTELYALVAEAFKKSNNAPQSALPQLQIEPFLLIQPNRDDQLLTALVFYAVQKDGDKVLWSEKYYYHFKDKMPASVLSGNDNEPLQQMLSANINVAVEALAEFVAGDVAGNTPNGKEFFATSPRFGTLPIPFKGMAVKTDDELWSVRIAANNINGLYARGMHILPKDELKFQ